MASIDSLPLEIFLVILELASEIDPRDYIQYRANRAMQRAGHRERTLVAASLVARSWQEPAQTLLWD